MLIPIYNIIPTVSAPMWRLCQILSVPYMTISSRIGETTLEWIRSHIGSTARRPWVPLNMQVLWLVNTMVFCISEDQQKLSSYTVSLVCIWECHWLMTETLSGKVFREQSWDLYEAPMSGSSSKAAYLLHSGRNPDSF